MNLPSMPGPTMGACHQPPYLPLARADRGRPASCLLALAGFIDSQTNASTACCDIDATDRVVQIQITFVVADPPQVSYFLAFCTGSIFVEKPTILCTEGNLALLHIGVKRQDYFGPDRYAFYVYHANGGSNGEPSLTVLPQPGGRRIVELCQIGLLPGGQTQDNGRDYHVAALLNAPEPLHFELYLYSSKTRAWTVKMPVLILSEQQRQAGEFRHMTYEVITVGGDYGTMGFVDHSRGDRPHLYYVLQGDRPHLYYVPLPTPLHPSRLDRHDLWRVCDVAVVGGRIRFVELCPRDKTHGWQAVMWSRSAANHQEPWRQDCHLLPSQLLSRDLPEQLPRDSYYGRGGPPPPTTWDLKRMYIENPTLSLHDDKILYLSISCHIGAWDRWVVAVDMASLTLRDVAHYRPEKTKIRFRHSKISNHVSMGASPGAKGCMKRPGVEVLESSDRKKQCVLPVMDVVSPRFGEQEHYLDAATILGAWYGDDMDLDMPTPTLWNEY